MDTASEDEIPEGEARFYPPLPGIFPRNSWYNSESFGIPPYTPPRTDHWEYCWAAREASRTWSRVIGQIDLIDRLKSYPESKHYPPSPDVIDDLCFALAVFDKTFEMSVCCSDGTNSRNYYYQRERAEILDPLPFSYAEWVIETDLCIEHIYNVVSDMRA